MRIFIASLNFCLLLGLISCGGGGGSSSTTTTTTTYTYTVTTLAGSGTYAFANGTGTAASFKTPTGLVSDTSGNIFVADTYNHQIRQITSSGVVTTFAGSTTSGNADGTGAAATFTYPHGIAIDSSGNFYVSANAAIRKITSAGVVTIFAGSSSGVSGNTDGTGTSARFMTPIGIAIDSSDNLYVADAGNNNIRKITSLGVVTTLAGPISGFASGSTNGTGSGASFSAPNFLAFDSSGNLYVTDMSNNMIRKVTSAGVVTTFAGSTTSGSADGTGTSATFYFPSGVVIDSSDNLYVAEQGNNLIRKITSAGVVTTIIGTTTSGSANGVGTAATLYGPQGIAKDSSGNLYIADYSNNLIRKVTITTTTN